MWCNARETREGAVDSESDISRTLAVRTADAIRDRILALTPGYAPGERLLPEAVAESLRVSMTPVREALRLLNSEGLVELLPRRGVRVATMTLDEIRDLTAVRGGIELLAIRLRAETYSPAEIAELEACLEACTQGIVEQDVREYRHFDTQVHRLIVLGSHSPTLGDVYEQLHRRAQILELYFTDTWDLYRESLAEHREIVKLLASGPIETIEATVVEHWQRSRGRISARFSRVALKEAVPDQDSAKSDTGFATLVMPTRR
jgi:DNA-binding GntR family transcriptional regulator